MTLQFAHFWLLPLAVIVASGTYYLTRRIIASVMLMSVVLALSCPFIVKKDLSEKTVFLVDRSMSMQHSDFNSEIAVLAESIPDNKQKYHIYFAEKPLKNDSGLNTACTDIESALFHSINKIGQNGKIYLFSDLLETKGDFNFALSELSSRNIALEIILPEYKRENEVILSKLRTPGNLTQNQTAEIEIVIESASKCDVRLEITNILSGTRQVKSLLLNQGLNQFNIPADTGAESLDYIISVNCEKDTYKDNNIRRIQAEIAPVPTVAVMGSIDEFDAIRSILNKYAKSDHITDRTVPDCDLVIISDAGSELLTEKSVSVLNTKISEGMGMLVLPGRQLLKDNLFEKEYFSKFLPAKLFQQKKKTSPDGCIVFIVDTSGSMQGARLIIAKGIVRSSIERLSAYDKAGIVEFYGNRKWAAPIQSAANQIDLNRAVNRLTAGGGTVILPAIEEAYYGLKNVETASRHIVVITDGGIESADYETLLGKLRDDGINVSFVMTGPAANAGFLSEMSMYGGGKFLHCPDRFSIPEIDIKTLSGKNTGPLIKNKYALSSPELNEILEGVNLADLPIDFSYIPSETKYTANTILQAGPNPLITGWQVGLGKVILSSTDLLSKERTEKLFQNICRRLYKKPDSISDIEISDVEFEIKSCQPDYALAEKIGKIKQSGHIDQIKTIDLDGYCLLISFVCFITGIITRRLPEKAAVFAAFFACSCLAFGDYPKTMKEGIDLYCSNNSASVDKFLDAYSQSNNLNDRKYSLAWALLTSQKYGRFEDLEKVLLKAPDKDSISCLNIAYAANGNFDSAKKLCRDIKTKNLSMEDKKVIEKQLVDIAMVSRQFDSAIEYYKANGDTAALMKIYLLKGDRDQALKIADSASFNKLVSSELYDFCIALNQMGFKDIALHKAIVLQSRKDDWFFEATVFIYEIYSTRGESEKSFDIIQSAIDNHRFTDKQLFELAILLEKAGKTNEAINIHKKVYQRTKAIDCLMRIAHLEQTCGNLKQSFQLWRHIWNSCDEAFMLYQITPSLLDIAARTDSLIDLVIELEDRISSGNSSQKKIDLLIDIYISVNDSFSPIEVVKQYYGNDSIESLGRQYQIYRKCKLYRNCSKILNKLIEIDQTKRFRYLQQLAITAVERSDDAAVLNAADKLKDAKNQLEPEFTAGLLSLIGRFEDAMKAYEKLISQNPENNELWLLWARQAAECSDSIKSMAIDRLSNLLTSESSDDRFLVAADALLNLEAAKKELQNAYQKTIARIKTGPDKVYLYRLAIDILSEINPSAGHIELLLEASCYAPQRRLAFIREAMDSLGDLSPQRLDFAMLLVYMDWQCSPGQYIKLGQSFLENGRSRLAEYLFRCNSLLNAENKGLFLTIADVYQKRSDFDSALNIILEALAIYPQDCNLLLEAASYYEILGRYDEAYKLYSGAYSLSSHNIKLSDKIQQKKTGNINPSQDYKRIATEGMIVTANHKLPDYMDKTYKERMDAVPETKKKKKTAQKKPESNACKKEKPPPELNMIDAELEEIISSNSFQSKHFYRIDSIIHELAEDQAEYLYDEYTDYAEIMGKTLILQYLRAGLAYKTGRNKEARSIIKACYLIYPQNRKVEFKLKKIMEAGRLYKELADIFVNAAENNAKSPHFWREITRLYYMAGDLEKSKWANSYASGESHFVLQLLDCLFLYTKEENMERMKQYFRKYQIDCRKKNKYYSLKWNYWDGVQEDGSIKERESVYMVLSRYSQLLPEFKRYKRTVYPDRRDAEEYFKAYENCKSFAANDNKKD